MIEEGTRIGRIRVEEPLGQGGMGSVFKGFDEILGRSVALKVSLHTEDTQPLDKLRFLREAQVLSKLDHPNICRIYDLIERPDADILVLEYISGKTLKQLSEEGALSFQELLTIFAKLAEVLARTHAVHIVHRDLKPENMMITVENQLKVLDFGLARPIGDLEISTIQRQLLQQQVSNDEVSPEVDQDDSYSLTLQQDGIFGTPRYMSPEQAGGRPLTSSSDMFSLGLVMLKVFTGKTVYEEGLPMPALVFRVSQGQYQEVSGLTDGLDADLAALIVDLTAFNPEERPTAEQARQRLEFILNKPQRKARMRRTLLILMLSLVAFIAGFFGLERHFRQEVLLQSDQTARVLVFPIINRSGEEGVVWGLRNMLVDSLAGHDKIRTIEERYLRDLTSSAPENSQTFNPEELAFFARSLGANFFVRSIFYRTDQGYTLRCTLFDLVGPKFTVEVRSTGMGFAARRMAEELVARIEPGTASRDSSFSNSDLVNQLYAIGLEKKTTAGPKAGLPFFDLCRTLDPDFHLATAQYAACLADTGEPRAAESLFRTLLGKRSAEMDPMLHIQLILGLSKVHFGDAAYDQAESELKQALALAETHNAPIKMAEIYNQLSIVHIRRREFDRASEILEQALIIFDREGQLQGKARSLSNMGVNVSDAGHLDEAEGYYNRSLQIARDIENLPLTATALLNLGVLMWEREDLDNAESFYLQALKINEGLGLKDQTATLFNNLAGVAMKRNDHQKVVDYFQRSLAIFQEMNHKPGIAMLSYNLSEYYLDLNRCSEAAALVGTALEYYQDDADTSKLAGRIAHCQQRFAEALELMTRARSLDRENWEPKDEALLVQLQERSRKN